MKQIKLIISDLDKTLLDSDKIISDYTSAVLQKCKQRGIKVAFATARSEHSCREYVLQINPDAIISNGGALVRIGDETVYRATVDIATSNSFIEQCLKEREVQCITVETDKGYFLNLHVDEDEKSWAEYQPTVYSDFVNGIDSDAYKITVHISDDETALRIAGMFSTLSVIKFAGEKWYRYADKNADKWHGVEALIRHLGITAQECAAFGDDYNDVEMIKNCVGIAVSNALDEVKTAADFICGSNDDNGVAKWISENILFEKE